MILSHVGVVYLNHLSLGKGMDTPIQAAETQVPEPKKYKIQMSRGWFEELKASPDYQAILKRKGLTEDEIRVIDS